MLIVWGINKAKHNKFYHSLQSQIIFFIIFIIVTVGNERKECSEAFFVNKIKINIKM